MNHLASRPFALAALVLLPLGCTSSETSSGTGTATDPTATDVEYAAGPFTIAPGEDKTMCSYVRSDSDEDQDVAAFLTQQSVGGHHLIVYTIDHPVDLPPAPCSQGGQPSWSQVLATQLKSEDITFPAGVGFRIKAHQQYVMETHFINTTTGSLDVSSKFGVRYAKPGTVQVRAATYFMGTMNIDVPANGTFEASVACNPPRPMTLRTMFGHQHRMGVGLDVHHTAAGAAEQMIYQSTNWEAPPITQFQDGLALQPTDTLGVHCKWDNTTPNELRYPHEMCIAIGYFWPADAGIFCASGGGTDTCACREQGNLDAGPGGAAVKVTLNRNATIPGAGGAVDKGAPIYCALFRAEDYTLLGPKQGAQPYYFRDAVDVPLADDQATVTFDIEDVTPGAYAVSCVMDVIGGGFMPGKGDIANASAPTVSVKKGDTANVNVTLDFAIP